MKFLFKTKLSFNFFLLWISLLFQLTNNNEKLPLFFALNPISIIIKKSQSYIQKHLYPLSYWYNLLSHYLNFFKPLCFSQFFLSLPTYTSFLSLFLFRDNSMYISVGITDINKYIKVIYSSVSLTLAIYRRDKRCYCGRQYPV